MFTTYKEFAFKLIQKCIFLRNEITLFLKITIDWSQKSSLFSIKALETTTQNNPAVAQFLTSCKNLCHSKSVNWSYDGQLSRQSVRTIARDFLAVGDNLSVSFADDNFEAIPLDENYIEDSLTKC